MSIMFRLTPVLQRYCEGFRSVVDDKLRYQQLLFLAAKATPMNDALKVEQNKVPGCLSTVFVHATIDPEGKVHYVGDSDSQLTKGLVTMLVNGLSGHTPDEIIAVDPEFVKYAGVTKSLTPGRNNGFVNMLHLMKLKAGQFKQQQSSSSSSLDDDVVGATAAAASSSVVVMAADEEKRVRGEGMMMEATTTAVSNLRGGPVSQSIHRKLSLLQPVSMIIEDESYKHAGHTESRGLQGSETHFSVSIVAACFEGLSRVKRHQMVYTLLAQELSNGVHALSINAKTPDEA